MDKKKRKIQTKKRDRFFPFLLYYMYSVGWCATHFSIQTFLRLTDFSLPCSHTHTICMSKPNIVYSISNKTSVSKCYVSYLHQHQQMKESEKKSSGSMEMVVICSRSGVSKFTTLFSAFSLNQPIHTRTLYPYVQYGGSSDRKTLAWGAITWHMFACEYFLV